MTAPDAVAASAACVLAELCTVQGPGIRTLVEALRDLVAEVDLCFTPGGLVLSNIDGTHMAMVRAHINADGVERYTCVEEKAVCVCVAHLHKLLKCVTHRDTLTLRLDSRYPEFLIVIIENHAKNSRSEAQLRLLDTAAGCLDMPAQDYDARVTMMSTDFQRVIKDMNHVGDEVDITVTSAHQQPGILMHCSGDIGNLCHFLGAVDSRLTVRFGNSREEAVCAQAGALPATSTSTTGGGADGEAAAAAAALQLLSQRFSLRFLSIITKSSQLSHSMELFFKRDFPLRIRYDLGSQGTLTYCLVPKSA